MKKILVLFLFSVSYGQFKFPVEIIVSNQGNENQYYQILTVQSLKEKIAESKILKLYSDENKRFKVFLLFVISNDICSTSAVYVKRQNENDLYLSNRLVLNTQKDYSETASLIIQHLNEIADGYDISGN